MFQFFGIDLMRFQANPSHMDNNDFNCPVYLMASLPSRVSNRCDGGSCACFCVVISVLLCRHGETTCTAAAAEEGPPKPGLTRSDSSVYLSLALTADRWIALIHRRKNRQREGGRGVERGRKRERKPPGRFACTALCSEGRCLIECYTE